MAEIEIKKKQPIWPWILLVAIILALLYFLFMNDDDTVDDVDDASVEMTTDDVNNVDEMDNNARDTIAPYATSDSDVESYMSYINEDTKMGIDHLYTNNALTELIDAVQSVANNLNVDVNADLSNARQYAAEITKDPYKVDHADKIKDGGNIIMKALKTIQSQKFPDLKQNVVDAENALNDIQPSVKTLEQKDAVKNFFQQAGELLTKMKNN